MSEARKLKPYRAPKPVVQACASCQTFMPECHVPHGEGTLPMCWICAHHFIDHGIALHLCGNAECECLPEAVYPESLIEARRERAADRAAVN